LRFDRGAVIEVIEKQKSGWWIGRIGNRVGSFPCNFVEKGNGFM
jgi:hypothetical protein